MEADSGRHQTAFQVLSFLKELNKIFLQDAAAISVLHGNRKNNKLFDLTVFHHQDWFTYCETMKMKLQSEDNPLDARVESVLPGIYQWHQSTVSTLKSMGETINARLDDLSKQQKELAEQQNDFAERFSNKLIGLGLEIRGRTGATVPPLDELAMLMGACQQSEKERPAASAMLMGACQQSEKERPAASPIEERKLLEIRHETLEKMYNEWYGLGSFTDDEGGIAGRNQKYGSAWRKHIPRQDYSRLSRIINAIDSLKTKDDLSTEDAIKCLEPLYQKCGKSLRNMVDTLQQQGYLTKGKPRGIKRKRQTESESDENM